MRPPPRIRLRATKSLPVGGGRVLLVTPSGDESAVRLLRLFQGSTLLSGLARVGLALGIGHAYIPAAWMPRSSCRQFEATQVGGCQARGGPPVFGSTVEEVPGEDRQLASHRHSCDLRAAACPRPLVEGAQWPGGPDG